MKSRMIKNQKKYSITLTFCLFAAIMTVSCTGKTAKQGEMEQVSSNAPMEKTVLEEAAQDTVKNIQQPIDAPRQKKIAKPEEMPQKDIDLDKIYEESEGVRAFPSLNNSQFMEFINKHFKYPDIDPVNGRGKVDLVIERDGTVSDVIIVEGIHPAIDKEFIRVLKLLPKFTPGKINGIPVRSKYRSAIGAQYM